MFSLAKYEVVATRDALYGEVAQIKTSLEKTRAKLKFAKELRIAGSDKDTTEETRNESVIYCNATRAVLERLKQELNIITQRHNDTSASLTKDFADTESAKASIVAVSLKIIGSEKDSDKARKKYEDPRSS